MFLRCREKSGKVKEKVQVIELILLQLTSISSVFEKDFNGMKVTSYTIMCKCFCGWNVKFEDIHYLSTEGIILREVGPAFHGYSVFQIH